MISFARWPGFHEIELCEPANPRKVAVVICDKHASRLPAGQGQKNIVGECLRDAGDLQALVAGHLRQEIAGSMPRVGGWR
jgi:hypothetical protein